MARIISKPIVVVSGSRSINYINFDLYMKPQWYSQILTGGAIGIDTLMEKWCRKNRIENIVYEAKWEIWGKRAGIIRNEEMVNAADAVIVFWDGKSPGSKHVIDYAKKINIPVKVHLIESRD